MFDIVVQVSVDANLLGSALSLLCRLLHPLADELKRLFCFLPIEKKKALFFIAGWTPDIALQLV
jgi:hypothetical protein